jgi:phosphate uptake regulator
MELRKIQRTRGGTFFVTLPKEWALKNGITRGSVVYTSVTSDGRLIIDPRYDLKHKPLAITIRPSPYLGREIIGKYLLGYDTIRISAKDRITMEQREIVKETVSKLIGLEIIEENHANIIIQCLLQPAALPPEKILRREYLISFGMFRDSMTAILQGDTQLARSVVARDNEVDRLYFLVVRILRTVIQNPRLSEKLEVFPIDCLDYRLTASLVESVGDQATQIAEHAIELEGIKLPEKIIAALRSLHESVNEAYQDAVAAFFSRSISLAESVREKEEKTKVLCEEAESACTGLPAEAYQRVISVISLIGRVYDHSVDISDLTIPRRGKRLIREFEGETDLL